MHWTVTGLARRPAGRGLWAGIGTVGACLVLAALAPTRLAAQSDSSPTPLPSASPPLAAAGASDHHEASPAAQPSYAYLADLADHAERVVRAKVRRIARLEPERAADLPPGQARLYIEAQAVQLLSGPALSGESLRYLLDVPLDARGKLPRRPRGDVLIFALTPPGRPGDLQLVAPDAQLPWTPETDARLKGILAELLAADAPPRVSGVREAISVAGALAGEGETQLFLATHDGEPAAITVSHRPGEAPRWSASFSEVLDASGDPPARDTLAWYRLACFLPARLPAKANVSASPAERDQAEADYRFVRDALGPCPRTRS